MTVIYQYRVANAGPGTFLKLLEMCTQCVQSVMVYLLFSVPVTMTVIYQYRVANAGLGTFLKLLVMWRGSVYKLMYKEMLIFTAMYLTISLTYRLALNPDQRQ